MKVEIWSDVVCPWCYIGKRRFEAALAAFPHRHQVEVVWRSFELDPRAPRERPGDLLEHLAAKYGVSRAEAEEMHRRVTAAAGDAGIQLDLGRARTGNTLDAHRLLHLAADHGVQDRVKERLLRAYFTEGEPIGDPAALTRPAVDAGLPSGEVAEVLDGDRYTDEVRAEEFQAHSYGVTGVPFFVFDRTYGVAGAQPPDVLASVLERAWSEGRGTSIAVSGPADGNGADACGDDACAL